MVNIRAVRTSRWETIARASFYAGAVSKFLLRRKTVRVFVLAALCLAVYLLWHAPMFLRLASVLGIFGLRILSKTQDRDATARMKARFARREAKVDAITEARLRKEPWRRAQPPLRVPEDHVGRYIESRQPRLDTFLSEHLIIDQRHADK